MSANPSSSQSKIPITGINHIALNVRNMERALKFYNEILGFPILMQTETRAGNQHVEVDAGNVAIALFEMPDLDFSAAQKTMTQDGFLHFAFEAPYDRLESIQQALKEMGVEMDGEPRVWDEGVSIYFPDPDGHQIEIHFDKE